MAICTHFTLCGGCSLQNLSSHDYRAAKREMVVKALARAGLAHVEVAEPVMVSEHSRRRAVFKLARRDGKIEIGFHAAKSHAIVDMRECLVLTPALFALTQTLRAALPSVLKDGEGCELHVSECDNGLDLAFRSPRKLTPALIAQLAKTLNGPSIARILFNKELVLENQSPRATFANIPVNLPPHAFLQATKEGEAALQANVLTLLKGAKHVADLFAGLGTFTFALARQARIHAVEQDGEALSVLAEAARKSSGLKPITIEKRDLFKIPLTPPELKAYDAVLLDPPRAGSIAQVTALAASTVRRLAYVSCDASSFARDAAILIKAGFRPGMVTPIDQFLYSGHIELVAGFERKP